ncbi:MAG: aminotransferase class IV [Bacteriovoracaceae bacterium]|nr:aminotransferase class IV [Bacteriovoracaceae bacterium]
MNQTLIYDSEFKTTQEGISPFSRAFLYGESIFSTLRFSQGKPLFVEDHLYRLELGYHWLFENQENFPTDKLRKGLKDLAEKHPEARVRLTFHLDNQLHEFVPSSGVPTFIIMLTELKEDFLETVPEISIGICDEPYLRGVPHFAKVGQYLHQVKVLKEFNERKLQDVLFLDDHRRLTEASTSNIFFRKGSLFMTPSLSEGLLDGVMRKNIIRYMRDSKWEFTEGHFDIYNLLESDEVWLCNSSGIRSVIRIDKENFEKTNWTDKLQELVVKGIENDQKTGN